jgi:hypothetical protein
MSRETFRRAESWFEANRHNRRAACLFATSLSLVALWTFPYSLVGVPWPAFYVGRYAGTSLLAGAWLPATLDHFNIPTMTYHYTATAIASLDEYATRIKGDRDGR